MKGSTSLAARLVVALTGATVLFWIAAAFGGALLLRSELDDVFDKGMRETAQRLMPLVVEDLDHRDETSEREEIGEELEGEHQDYLTFQVRGRNGAVLLSSYDAPKEPYAAALAPGFADTETDRIYTVASRNGRLFLQVADPLAHRLEAAWEGALALMMPLALLVPASVFVVWWIVRRALSPVGALQAAIGERGSGNLAPLEVAGLPSELAAISASVDRLLTRLRAALEAEREFAANSAHELRTPIAGALAQTQRLVAELAERPERKRARQIEQSLAQLSRLTEKLLQLARAEAGIGAVEKLADLLPVLRLVVDEFARRPEFEGRLVLDSPAASRLSGRVDLDAFAIVMRNLIDNALAHGTKDEPVTVRVEPGGAVAVVNAGAIVPQQDLSALTKRFRRGRTEAGGSGLGLAIAERLVEQMGARLELTSPAPGRGDGFQARVVLPA